MPIKAGQLAASAPGKLSTMISDGKRMRVVWEEGDGNGDASAQLVERTQTTVKGHPTWKVFCGEVPNTIIRGKNEPPRYIYLDDLACHAVWRSQLYTKEELKSFWPFDFDHVAKIKPGRMNRGRPAYHDDSFTEYAKGTLRTKEMEYEFCGAPDFIGYTPAQSSKDKTKLKKESSPDLTIPKLITPIIPSLSFPLSPIGSPAPAATTPSSSRSRIPPPTQNRDLGNGRIPWEATESRRYVAGPADGSLLPLGMAHKAIQGSPYFETPAAAYRSRPRPRGGDLAATLGIQDLKRKAMRSQKEKGGPKASELVVKKRKFVRPFASSSSEAGREAVQDESPGTILESIEK